jgi:EAL domain-containing protein (putative c-di-GMP-specific phosphodiesterase class I)
VLNAAGETIGHEGFVRAGADRQLSPWALFSQAAATADPNWLVALDRLCRTLHAANYFPYSAEGQRLFLSVQPGLLSAVARDHGEVFAGILRLMGIAAERVVIQLPGSLNGYPELLRSAADSFQSRGFGLALNFTGGASALLASALRAPVFIKIDPTLLPAGTPLAQLLAGCQRRGLVTILKRIEAADTTVAAGADLMQGFAFGRPQSRPQPGSWRDIQSEIVDTSSNP